MKVIKSKMNLFLVIGVALCLVPIIATLVIYLAYDLENSFDAHSLGLSMIEFLPFSIIGSIIFIIISRKTKTLKRFILATSISMYASFLLFVVSAMSISYLLGSFLSTASQTVILNILMIIFCVSEALQIASGTWLAIKLCLKKRGPEYTA